MTDIYGEAIYFPGMFEHLNGFEKSELAIPTIRVETVRWGCVPLIATLMLTTRDTVCFVTKRKVVRTIIGYPIGPYAPSSLTPTIVIAVQVRQRWWH
jgi:hypothetical protein